MMARMLDDAKSGLRVLVAATKVLHTHVRLCKDSAAATEVLHFCSA
jgi:hypothetical protein